MHPPVVLGLDFGGSKIAVAVADASGRRLDDAVIEVDAHDLAPVTFERAVTAGRQLIGERDLVAVGACTFGIPRDDGIDLAPTIAGWDALAFGAELQQAFPTAEIRTATDVKAAARAEAEHGALTGYNPGLYLNLGTGLAVALVVDGRVVSGRNGAAGEIGYNLRDRDDPPEAVRLEEVVSGKALARYAGGEVAALFAGADTDPALARICHEFVSELSFHLVNLAITVDPARIAVGGGLVRAWDRIGPPLEAALQSGVPYPPELVVADHPFDAPLIGALALGTAAARDVLASRAVISEGAPA